MNELMPSSRTELVKSKFNANLRESNANLRELSQIKNSRPSALDSRPFALKNGSNLSDSSVPIVIIRSYKSEKFGRYLVDLWYLKDETNKERILREGRFLNQVLLDKGLAQEDGMIRCESGLMPQASSFMQTGAGSW